MPDPTPPRPPAPKHAASSLDPALEQEIRDAMGSLSAFDMLDAPGPGRGGASSGTGRASRRGTVVDIHGGDVLVEFGPRDQGVCPLTQFEAPPTPGDMLEFIVERRNPEDGLLLLSRSGAIRRAEWDSLDVGQTVEARCTAVNKGGLELDLAGHRAFMPAGQVDLQHIEDLSIFIGEKLPCVVIELDRARARLILSRRAHLDAERARQREKTLATLEAGATVEGVVRSIQAFGAFVDIGGVDGLIHLSDLSWERIRHPSEVVRAGQAVRVKILRVETDHEPPRISLGLKQTMEDPFRAESSRIAVGDIVTGRVTRLADFGAFVEIAPGVEGLVHISELSRDRVRTVSSVVKIDEVVQVKVLSVDPGQRRIGLSLRAAREAAEESDPARPGDPEIERLKERLRGRFGSDLRGGLG